MRVYITGRSRVDPAQLPPNVVLTGYLSRADYQELLHTVDAVMVLTTAEENLVCGGYEAVAAGKPLIVSGTDALRGLYRQGAIFTTNDSAGLARSIERAREQRAELAAAIVEQKRTMESEWDACWATLLAEIGVSQAEPAPVRDTVAAAI